MSWATSFAVVGSVWGFGFWMGLALEHRRLRTLEERVGILRDDYNKRTGQVIL